MGTSPETFARVKDLLKKLDRSIDDARNRRHSAVVTPPSQQMKPGGGLSPAPNGVTPPPQPLQPRPGRAKPMGPRPIDQRPGFGSGGTGPR